MTNRELAENAYAFATNARTCYLKGGYGQRLTYAEYNRLCTQYPDNAKYKNADKANTDYYPFDCICFVKALTSGLQNGDYLTYNQLKNGPLGDCTNKQFIDGLYDCCAPKDAPAGYGLATSGHAAISLGGGAWIDANFSGAQNGVQVHTSGIEQFTKAGKIKGVTYNDAPITERDTLIKFVTWLVNYYLKNR